MCLSNWNIYIALEVKIWSKDMEYLTVFMYFALPTYHLYLPLTSSSVQIHTISFKVSFLQPDLFPSICQTISNRTGEKEYFFLTRKEGIVNLGILDICNNEGSSGYKILISAVRNIS